MLCFVFCFCEKYHVSPCYNRSYAIDGRFTFKENKDNIHKKLWWNVCTYCLIIWNLRIHYLNTTLVIVLIMFYKHVIAINLTLKQIKKNNALSYYMIYRCFICRLLLFKLPYDWIILSNLLHTAIHLEDNTNIRKFMITNRNMISHLSYPLRFSLNIFDSNRICGVMVGMLVSSTFEPRSGQT